MNLMFRTKQDKEFPVSVLLLRERKLSRPSTRATNDTLGNTRPSQFSS